MVTSIPINFNREFLGACIQGDAQRQKALYDTFSPTMFAICLRYANDYHHAEDILQEGFIKVFKRLNRFRYEGSFEGWLKKIFVHTAIEHYRKSLKFSGLEEVNTLDKHTDAPLAQTDLQAADLIQLVQQLAPGYRTVFNLYAIEGYSHKEISSMLKISVGTSKSQLARARTTLQRRVNQLKLRVK
ncbi:MAG: RNA polymerase sigma factor [Saprospiraceae bacterium]